MECNYLSLPEIPAFCAKIHIYGEQAISQKIPAKSWYWLYACDLYRTYEELCSCFARRCFVVFCCRSMATSFNHAFNQFISDHQLRRTIIVNCSSLRYTICISFIGNQRQFNIYFILLLNIYFIICVFDYIYIYIYNVTLKVFTQIFIYFQQTVLNQLSHCHLNTHKSKSEIKKVIMEIKCGMWKWHMFIRSLKNGKWVSRWTQRNWTAMGVLYRDTRKLLNT